MLATCAAISFQLAQQGPRRSKPFDPWTFAQLAIPDHSPPWTRWTTAWAGERASQAVFVFHRNSEITLRGVDHFDAAGGGVEYGLLADDAALAVKLAVIKELGAVLIVDRDVMLAFGEGAGGGTQSEHERSGIENEG